MALDGKTIETGKALYNRMQEQPTWFTKNILGVDLWPKQEEIINSVRDNARTAARSCHGVGKSYVAGQVILQFLYSWIPSIVLSTAPTWRQVEKLIWKEVRASYRKSNVALGGSLLPKSPEIQITQDEWYAIGLSTNDPDRFQGFHEKNILVVVDEAAGVSEDIFEAIEGVLTSEHARLLLLGNPTAIGGSFYKSFHEPGWNTIHISCFDTPNFTAFGITEEDIKSGAWEEKITGPLPNPNLITPTWVADKFKRWGPTSPAYQARCLGQFPTEGADTLIPLAWIEAAMERWHDMPDEDLPSELGVDVARFGSDHTVIAPRKGYKSMPLKTFSMKDTMETAGNVIVALREEHATMAKVDVIGIGAGVVDRLNELGHPVQGINSAESAYESDKYINLRSELWWNLRDMLNTNPRMNPNPIGLPPDDELLADLSGLKYKITSQGKVQVESKEEYKKRLGRSPDKGDAVVYSYAPVRGLVTDQVRRLLKGASMYGS